MAAKQTWEFRSRLRSGAFGWRGSHLACQRLKEAAAEIKSVARTDALTAGDGVVTLMERIWPAFQNIDTSSGALGGAVYWAQQDLLPIAIAAPADRRMRDKWLERLWQAVEDDGVDYLSVVQDRWGELCVPVRFASDGRTASLACSGPPGPDPRPGNYVRGTSVYLSSLLGRAATRNCSTYCRSCGLPSGTSASLVCKRCCRKVEQKRHWTTRKRSGAEPTRRQHRRLVREDPP